MDDPPDNQAPVQETTGEPELETLRKERDSLAGERDRLQQELQQLRRNRAVQELASHCGFTDPEYLDYLLLRRSADPESPEAETLIRELQERSPKLFRVPLHPGAPTPPAGTATPPPGTDDRHAALIRQLENAPEKE